MNVIRGIGLFAAAGLAEIGGGYLIWRWLREGAPWPVGLAGQFVDRRPEMLAGPLDL